MRFLIYNFLGRANDFSDLLPNERFAVMAGIIAHHGHNVEIWDRANIDDLLLYSKSFMNELENLEFYDENVSDEYRSLQESELNRIISGGFDVVFMNLWRGPGFKFSVELGNKLKKLSPGTLIFAIGQGSDRLRQLLFNVAPYLDAVIYGLNYIAVKGICEGKDYRSLPNIVYKEGDKIVFTRQETVSSFENMPLPIYDEDTYVGISGKFPIYPISLSNEACPFACPFCMRPASYGTQVVEKKMDMVIMELKHLMRRYNARMFRISDSTPPYMALTKFATRILDEGLEKEGIIFSGFSRLDVSGGDDFEKISVAGIKALFFGIETLDEGNQERIRKRYPISVIKNRLKSSHDAGIFNIGSFIFPLPGETRDSMETTLRNLRDIASYLGSVLIQPAGVYPETEWRNYPERYGIKVFDDYDIVAPVYPVKYILPIRYWKPFPFSYELMGKSADDVIFEDIVSVFEEFCFRVKEEIGLPIGIQDYDFVASSFLGENHLLFTKKLVEKLVQIDYHGLKQIIEKARQRLV